MLQCSSELFIRLKPVEGLSKLQADKGRAKGSKDDDWNAARRGQYWI